MIQTEAVIVVPCYNEEKRFPSEKFLEFATKTSGFRFLFVDDGSKDRTFEVLEALGKKNPEVFSVLKLEKNGGKAEAVRRGFLQVLDSGAPYVGFWDADLATPLEVLPYFLRVFLEEPKVEMVLGARVKLMGRDIQRKALRHYLGRVFATCASSVLGLSIYDTQCGAKIFRVTDTLKAIFQEHFGSKWIFDVEILARYMKKTGLGSLEAESRIYELSLRSWKDVAGSKVKPTDFFKAFGELIKIYVSYRR